MQTELSCSRHVLPRKKKVVKTRWFPAACGLPTGSEAEWQHQPHSAFGSVKMLFTKVKRIASPGVKEPFDRRVAQDPVEQNLALASANQQPLQTLWTDFLW